MVDASSCPTSVVTSVALMRIVPGHRAKGHLSVRPGAQRLTEQITGSVPIMLCPRLAAQAR
ncbi:hypothetical protein [uncultured Methylibium sp.]|uniref:hypothetical protein n=1 Tax=uncultured Methylibium sp. TaxID=381093 RepID=UPI0025D64AB4|nr:hypothetical protein [uncultured Methylibium sp.]